MVSDADIHHVEEMPQISRFFSRPGYLYVETARLAEVVLQDLFAEKDGTFTNTERKVKRVRKAVEPIGESRPDWKIICDLSTRMVIQ